MQDGHIVKIIEELKECLKDDVKSRKLLDDIQLLLNEKNEVTSDDKERYRAVVDNVVDGIITINHKGIVQTFNLSAEKLFGYLATEVIGKNVKMLMPSPYFDEHDTYLQNFMGGGKPKVIGLGRQVTGLRKDGRSFPMDLSVSKINMGKEVMFAGIVRDTSQELHQKEELEQSQLRLQSIVDNVYEGILTIDSKGSVDSYNLAAEKIFGYSASEVIGRNVKMLMPEPYFGEHDGYLSNYMNGGKAKVIGIDREVSGLRKDGTIFPLYLAVTKILNHGQPLFVGMVRDLSEQKRLENLKNEFVSTVSHELRTPLTSIRGSLSLIDSGVMGEVGEKIVPLVKIALNNSNRLILLINDILDMEKMESGKMDFNLEYTDLATLIQEAIEANEAYAKEHDVYLKFHDSGEKTQIYVDTNRMLQVLTNLISNAVKFSPKHDTVTLRSILSNQVRVEVHDNGPGIPEAFKKQIFQKFAQADSSDTKQKGGTGLGLNITKAIIEKLGGSIGFYSPEGEGTTFFFDLPVTQETKVRVDLPKNIRGKVLIVEDDHDIATLLRMMLQQEGLECDIAYDTSEAKVLLNNTKYDAMTLDVMLPGQDGMSLLAEMKKDDSLKDLAVIVVSAKAIIKKEEGSALAMEVIDWINKPIDQDRLVTSLKKAIEVHENNLPSILHVEDDKDIANFVKILLEEVGEIDLAINKKEALQKLEHYTYDLIILDMMLPDGSAREILPYIKEQYPSTPIILFSAEEVDQKLKNQVSETLIKSRTSNAQLVKTIKKILAH